MAADSSLIYSNQELGFFGTAFDCMHSFKKGDTIHWYCKNPDSAESLSVHSFKGFLHLYDIFYNEIRFIYKSTNNQSAHHIMFFISEKEYNASICRLVLIEKEFRSKTGYPIKLNND